MRKTPVPKDFQPGDDVCNSCTGITYFTSEMRTKGQSPMCFGKRGTLKKKVTMEKLVALDKQNMKKNASTGYTVYSCIGYSQSSGRMDRRGEAPICVRGTELHYARDSTSHSSNKSTNSHNTQEESRPTSDPNRMSTSRKTSSNQSEKPSDRMMTPTSDAMSSFSKNGAATSSSQHGPKPLTLSIDSNVINAQISKEMATTNFPDKMQRSAVKMIQASSKTLFKCQGALHSMWSDLWKRR
eukprot:gene7870-16110_t